MTTPPAGQSPLFARRELGVLLHPTSLFGSEDVGTLGRHAFAFVDWLEQAGATIWQILPLTPNGLHNSPYFSPSAFAGNPWLIDLDTLRQHGLLEGHAPEPVQGARVPFARSTLAGVDDVVPGAAAGVAWPISRSLAIS